MLCSNCGAENPAEQKFCNECAAPFKKRCAKCGYENAPAAKFCGECAAALTSDGSKSTTRVPSTPSVRVAPERTATDAADGERKTVTALFADIKGSMELMEDLDPEEARAIVDPALKLMMDAVHRYDGYIVQSTGDGIFALFGAPVAHEDHPQRALYAALRMQEDTGRYAERLRADKGVNLQVRVGVNTGEVVVRTIKTGESHAEYTPIGHSTNLASRLQALASPGSIAISDAVRKLVEGYFALRSLGPARIKGVSEPVGVYEVTGLGPLRTRLQRSAGRGLTKFVGRESEMESMRRAAELARQGHGQIVAAVAEAGVGKSRLLYEFKMRNQSGWMVLEALSVSHGKASAYLPVIDLLHAYFDIKAEDDGRRRREKVNGKVITLDPALEEVRPFLFALLGLVEGEDPLARMDAEIRRRRTLDAVKHIVLRESLNQPLMVVFEDLHWIDAETQALLDLLAESIATARVLLLVNYRPEYAHRWGSKTYYTQLRLDPLGAEGAAEMLLALLGADQSLSPIKRVIMQRTEGNPFFMEEIVQSLFEEGALVRNGTVKAAKPIAEFRLPPTVQGILAARIDRLQPAEKDLLQTMAVIGRDFPHRLIVSVMGGPERALEARLSNLQLAEFVYEQPAVGDIEYTFKHALTQEVAYNSVLAERRKLLHERIANAIEQLFAGRLDDHLAELAHHFVRSGNADKAAQYLVLAAQQALWSSALDEAIADVHQGLSLLEGIADQAVRARREAALQATLGFALSRRKPAGEGVETAYLRARELSARLGDDQLLFSALAGLRLCYNFRAELDRALELGMEMLKAAERSGDPRMLLGAHSHLSQTLHFRGELSSARAHLEQAAALVKQGVAYPNLTFLGDLAGRRLLVLCLLGYPKQADPSTQPVLTLPIQQQRLAPLFRELFASQIHYLLRDPVRVAQHAQRGSRLADELGSHQIRGYIAACNGWSLAASGHIAEGIAEIRRGLEILDTAEARVRTLPLTALAECYLMQGKLGEGLDVLSGALEHARRTGERFFEAELHRLTGEALARRGSKHYPEAETAFRAAIDVTRHQQARWLELRATASLARLLAKQGKRDEARTMLAEIYNWFTEGFDTADLKDAKALLDELGA